METLRKSTLYPGDSATLPHRLVLRQRDHCVHPFVVHLQVFDRDGAHRCYVHGHYCATLREGLDTFAAQCRRYSLTPLPEED